LAAAVLVFPISGGPGPLSFFFSDRSSDTILAALANRWDLRLLVCFHRADHNLHSNCIARNATPTHPAIAQSDWLARNRYERTRQCICFARNGGM